MKHTEKRLEYTSLLMREIRLTEKAINWFLKSYKFECDSYEWQICRLKHDIYIRESSKILGKAVDLGEELLKDYGN